MKNTHLVFFFLGAASLAALLLYFSFTTLEEPAGLYAPQPTPDRIILSWSADPATTQSVTWRTDVSVKEAFAEIAPADPSPDFPGRATSVKAATELLVTDNNAAHFHSVTFTGLQPATLYAYRVGSGDHWSEWFHFKTASGEEAPFAFLYFGDAQNDIKSLWSRCIRQAYSTMPDADFLLHAGDLINRANRDEEWGEWFYAGGWIYGMKSNIATPGNHEYGRNVLGGRELSKIWKPTFTFPANGPEGLDETVYYLDYQCTRIISLDTPALYADDDAGEAQAKWLEGVLSNNPNRWTIVTQHHPVYSTARGRDNEEVREAFQPLFEKYGVDLVLQGHDHSYGRGHNLQFGASRKDKGPIYVVSVSGPKMYNLNFEEWMERAASNTQLYQIIKVDGNLLSYEAYTATGQLYDAFELRKRNDGANKFIDRTPKDVPEIISIPERLQLKMEEEEVREYRQRFEEYKARNKGRKDLQVKGLEGAD
ncbi:MAG: metallophosphoesterase family protein [Lewinellaceae bacterium]|nr:metallophosphoesterase family protein [Lewinellaceae bacterium]